MHKWIPLVNVLVLNTGANVPAYRKAANPE